MFVMTVVYFVVNIPSGKEKKPYRALSYRVPPIDKTWIHAVTAGEKMKRGVPNVEN